VSGLAGLHAHFYLATAAYAQPGDVGCFVTSSEWLDVNYGAIIRALLLDGLGGTALHVIDPRAVPFEDAMTTAAIACFEVGKPSDSMRLSLVQSPAELRDLGTGREIARAILAGTRRWTPLFREVRASHGRGMVPLRAVARVHRGVATGANDFFILTRQRARELGVEQWCRPAITSAQEILQAGGVIRDSPERRLILDVPADLDRKAHPALDAYLRTGEQQQGDRPPVSQRYITSHRRPWWHLGPSVSPPIVVTYMARQAPVFALNPDGLALVNVAHGLYPIRGLGQEQLTALVDYLNGARESFRGSGRTYHGGLEKFEPRELEALSVPAATWG
jgi:adenine-specific DNA-methyltransferase